MEFRACCLLTIQGCHFIFELRAVTLKKPEFSCAILSKLDLDDIKKVEREPTIREDDLGRSFRKPVGIFKALTAKRLQRIPSSYFLFI
jgi:hypothetical protein